MVQYLPPIHPRLVMQPLTIDKRRGKEVEMVKRGEVRWDPAVLKSPHALAPSQTLQLGSAIVTMIVSYFVGIIRLFGTNNWRWRQKDGTSTTIRSVEEVPTAVVNCLMVHMTTWQKERWRFVAHLPRVSRGEHFYSSRAEDITTTNLFFFFYLLSTVLIWFHLGIQNAAKKKTPKRAQKPKPRSAIGPLRNTSHFFSFLKSSAETFAQSCT
jgi:hypothetical protein